MSKNEFNLDLIGCLQQAQSKKQINADIRQIEKSINMLRITGILAKGDTKREINAYIKELSDKLSYVKLKGKIDEKNLQQEINKSLHNMSFDDIDALKVDENKTKLKLKKVMADLKAFAEKNTISVNVGMKKEKLNNDLTIFLNKNSKIRESSFLLEESERIRELINSVNDKGTLKNATEAFQLYKSEVSATGYATKSTTDKIKGMLSHITKIGSLFGLASLAVNNFKKSLSTLKGNDTILTEISKTSEMTKKQLEELGNEAFKVASKYGQLSSGYLLGVQEMARSGYESLSKELAELSLLAQSAGDMTAENANNYLLATDAAYKYGGSVEKLNAALDGANYISNRNSASLTDIADATRVSASFASNAEVAIDELTAAEATMIATTKRSGSEIGRAFRSIILNLQQVSGEFDGEIIDEEQLKKVEARCHSLGVELEYVKDGVATLRNPMEVLKDLARVYNSLPDNSAEKQGLISDIGGKYHANSLSALLSRWDLYEKMLSEFSQGMGSALEEAEKTADSWGGRLAALQNSWDSFINTLTNKDTIMGGISFFDRLIQGAETLTNTIGEIPVVLTALNSALVATNKDYGITQIWNKDKGKIDLQGNLFGIDITNIKNMKKHFAEAEEAIAKWNAVLVTGNVDINDFGEAIVQNNAQFKEYLSTCTKDAPATLEGYKAHLKAAGVSTDALRLKTILLNSVITMLGGWAIQTLITGFYKLSQVSNAVAEKANELGNSFKSTASDIDSYKSKIEDLYKTINDSNSSISDVTEARKNLMTIQTELIDKYGTEEKVIQNVTDAINGQADALDKLTQNKWQEIKNEFNDSGFWERTGNWLNGFNDNIERMIATMEAPMKILSFSANDLDSKKFDDLVQQMEKLGWKWQDTFGGFVKQGNLKGIYSDILEIQNAVKDLEAPDGFLKDLTHDANSIKEILDDYGEMWDTYVLRDVILENEKLTQSWKDVSEAYSEYRKAFEVGDKEAQNGAIDNFSQSLNNVLDNSEVADSVKEYFRNMYPALANEAEKWEFRYKILPEFDTHALKGKTQADILEMLQTDGSQYGEDTFNSLIRMASDYGIIIGNDSEKIEQLLDLLVEWEILQGNIADMDVPETPITFSSALSSESLSKFQSTIDSLKSSLTTLYNGDYSSTELISALTSINKAMTDIGKSESIDWEELTNLDDLDNVIDQITNEYVDSMLDSLDMAGTEFGNTIRNVIQEELKASRQLETYKSNVSDLQSAYSDLTDVTETYNETGYITFDQLTSLLEMEPQYLSCLIDENGQLQLNEQAMADLAHLRLDEAKAQVVQEAISELNRLSEEKQTKAVNDNSTAYLQNIQTISKWNEALGTAMQNAGVATPLFAGLSAALGRAVSNGASDEDINQVLDNAYKKFQMIGQVESSIGSNLGGVLGKTSSSSSSASSTDDYKEQFDFFERRVEVLNDAVNLLKANLENVNGSFAKNQLLDQSSSILEERMRNYSEAAKMYQEKAQESLSKLDSGTQKRIIDGSVNITDYIGEGNKAVVEAMNDYKGWADKVAECTEELANLKEELRQLELDKFNHIIQDFTDQFDLRDNAKNLIDKQIALFKEAGELIGESFYTAQIDQSQKQLALLENEKAELVNQMTSAIGSGRVQKGTEEWLEMVKALNDVDGNILDCKKSIEEFDNAIQNLHWETFDRVQDSFKNISDEISNLIGMMDDSDVATKDNQWTKEGLTQLGLYAQQYELATYQVSQYADEIDKLNADYLNGKYSATEYADKLADLNSAQWDAVNAAESAKDSIMDLNEARVDIVVKGIQEEIDAYKELVDSKIKALDAEKDLHEYQNTIAEKSKNISKIEKQLAAMQNDNTAATIAKRKQLEEQLAEARTDLEETQYDHSVEVQKEALNQQYQDYEDARNKEIEALEETLTDRENMIASSMESVKQNTQIVAGQITEIANKHGIKVSATLTNSWQSGENAIASYGEVLSQNTSVFIGNIMNVENEVWNLQAQADVTAVSLANMFGTKADNLVNELNTSYFAQSNLLNMTNALHDSLINTLQSGYDVSNIVNSFKSIENSANSAKAAIDRLNSTPKSEPQAPDAFSYLTENIGNHIGDRFNELGNAATGTLLKGEPVGTKHNETEKLKGEPVKGKAPMKKYASGSRSIDKDQLAIVNEEGPELIYSPTLKTFIAPLREGDMVFDNESSERLWKLGQGIMPPDITQNMGLPQVPPNVNNNNTNIHFDSMFRFEGAVIDTAHVKKQMEGMSRKITKEVVVDTMKQAEKTRKYGMF